MTETKKILLIGRSGRGKSTLANVLTTTNKFKESESGVSETRKIQFEQFKDKENNYLIIDTPGIGDTKLKDNEVLDIIAEAVYLVREGVNQVFFVIGKRFDQYEMSTYNLLRTIIFDENITKHTTISRTRFEEFRNEKECKSDISLMVKEARERKTELENNIATKEEKVKNLSSDSDDHQNLLEEIEQLKKELTFTNLAEIMESCQEKVVYVNNPPIDIEDEDELELNVDERNDSREILLEHLQTVCQSEVYKPEKLTKLSDAIAKDYFDYMKKKEELAAELAKLAINNSNSVNYQSITAITNSKNASPKSEIVITENKEPSSPTKTDNLAIGERIIHLETKRKQLEQEIQAKEKVIRQKVLKHIFNNYEGINKELGGDTLLTSVIGDYQ